LEGPERSSSTRNGRAVAAVALGLLSVACVPAGIGVAHYSNVDLIQAGWAVIPGFVLGSAALWLARRARQRSERTIGRVGGRRTAGVGRFLGAAGVYLALTGALALAIYEVLDYLSA
jgi:hypothetical protein